MEVTAEITEWQIHRNFYGSYATGRILGDAKGRWRSGTWFHTSQIVSTEAVPGGHVIITLNSSYFLRDGAQKPLEAHREVLSF